MSVLEGPALLSTDVLTVFLMLGTAAVMTLTVLMCVCHQFKSKSRLKDNVLSTEENGNVTFNGMEKKEALTNGTVTQVDSISSEGSLKQKVSTLNRRLPEIPNEEAYREGGVQLRHNSRPSLDLSIQPNNPSTASPGSARRQPLPQQPGPSGSSSTPPTHPATSPRHSLPAQLRSQADEDNTYSKVLHRHPYSKVRHSDNHPYARLQGQNSAEERDTDTDNYDDLSTLYGRKRDPQWGGASTSGDDIYEPPPPPVPEKHFEPPSGGAGGEDASVSAAGAISGRAGSDIPYMTSPMDEPSTSQGGAMALDLSNVNVNTSSGDDERDRRSESYYAVVLDEDQMYAEIPSAPNSTTSSMTYVKVVPLNSEENPPEPPTVERLRSVAATNSRQASSENGNSVPNSPRETLERGILPPPPSSPLPPTPSSSSSSSSREAVVTETMYSVIDKSRKSRSRGNTGSSDSDGANRIYAQVFKSPAKIRGGGGGGAAWNGSPSEGTSPPPFSGGGGARPKSMISPTSPDFDHYSDPKRRSYGAYGTSSEPPLPPLPPTEKNNNRIIDPEYEKVKDSGSDAGLYEVVPGGNNLLEESNPHYEPVGSVGAIAQDPMYETVDDFPQGSRKKRREHGYEVVLNPPEEHHPPPISPEIGGGFPPDDNYDMVPNSEGYEELGPGYETVSSEPGYEEVVIMSSENGYEELTARVSEAGYEEIENPTPPQVVTSGSVLRSGSEAGYETIRDTDPGYETVSEEAMARAVLPPPYAIVRRKKMVLQEVEDEEEIPEGGEITSLPVYAVVNKKKKSKNGAEETQNGDQIETQNVEESVETQNGDLREPQNGGPSVELRDGDFTATQNVDQTVKIQDGAVGGTQNGGQSLSTQNGDFKGTHNGEHSSEKLQNEGDNQNGDPPQTHNGNQSVENQSAGAEMNGGASNVIESSDVTTSTKTVNNGDVFHQITQV